MAAPIWPVRSGSPPIRSGRDGAIVSDGSGGWRGIARDWAPMRSQKKRSDIADWTRAQDYCG